MEGLAILREIPANEPMRKPFNKVNIEISNICNLQCSFCPEVVRSKKVMPPLLFRRIIEQVSPLTELVCLHLMGDPLVHPQLEELIQICEDHQTKIFLVTNGVLLREKQMTLLESPAFYQVNFSLHSFHDNFGEKDPSAYLERIFEYTEKALKERPTLYINYRLWNLQETRGTGPQNKDLLQRIENRFSFRTPENLDVTKQKSLLVKGRLYLHFDTEFIWPSLDLPILGESGRCHGLSSHFGVLVDGTVVPCCLDKEGNIPLGKIQETPIRDILGTARAQKILRGFRENRLEEDLCKRCQYIERFS